MSRGSRRIGSAWPAKNCSTHSSAGTSPSKASAMREENSSTSRSSGSSRNRSIARQRMSSSDGPLPLSIGTLSGIAPPLALDDFFYGQLEHFAGRLARHPVVLAHLPAHRPGLLEVPAAHHLPVVGEREDGAVAAGDLLVARGGPFL